MSMLPGIGIMPSVAGGGGDGGSCNSDECQGCAYISTNDGSYQIAAIPIIPRNPVIMEVRAVARRVDAPGRAAYVRRALFYRGPGGVATVMSTFDTSLTRESDAGWNTLLDVSGSAAVIQVQGGADSLVNWKVCWIFNDVTTGLLTTDNAYQTIKTIPIPDNTVCLLEAYVVGLRADASGQCGYLRRAIVYRDGGGAAAMQGVEDTYLTRESVANWDAVIDVFGNNAVVRVRGDTGQTVAWKMAHVLEELS